jgi:hypothetical protein
MWRAASRAGSPNSSSKGHPCPFRASSGPKSDPADSGTRRIFQLETRFPPSRIERQFICFAPASLAFGARLRLTFRCFLGLALSQAGVVPTAHRREFRTLHTC